MARISTAFFADDVRDLGNGRYDASGIYVGDVIFSNPSSAKLKNSVVFCLITDLKIGKHSLDMRVRSSSAGRLEIGGSEFDIEEEDTNFISIARIQGMFFPKAGDYELEIEVDGIVLKSLQFTIVFEQDDHADEGIAK